MSPAEPPLQFAEPPTFCGQCGQALDPNAVVCPVCHAAQTPSLPPAPSVLPAAAPQLPLRVPQVNGFAIASLVLGIVWLDGVGSVLAIIFGHIALKQIQRSGGYSTGRGMAIAGLVLGYIGIAGLILVILFMVSLLWFVPHPHLGGGVIV
ncbi:MAG: DUF4190 domain-containing protein [Terriglobales bacterium]